MDTATTPSSASLRPLLLTSAVCSLAAAVYTATRITPSVMASILVVFTPFVAALLWIRTDSHLRRVPLVHDLGLLLLVAWPVVIPWYTVKTRGRHSWPLASLLMAATVGPFLAQFIVAVVQSILGRGQ